MSAIGDIFFPLPVTRNIYHPFPANVSATDASELVENTHFSSHVSHTFKFFINSPTTHLSETHL